jgi:hypothetical protein
MDVEHALTIGSSGSKKDIFCEAQEATRMDVEHAFGALQSCFAIVRVQLEYGMGTQKETL